MKKKQIQLDDHPDSKDYMPPKPDYPPYVSENNWVTAHHDKFKNYGQPSPRLYVGQEVVDLIDGEHFDSLLQDGTDDVRTSSLILFWDSFDTECSKIYNEKFYGSYKNHKTIFPAREDLLLALYDVGAAPVRAWYKFDPERDLATRFGVTECPSLVFVPRKCTGWTKWCVKDETNGVQTLGCEDFEEACSDWVIWNEESDSDYPDWVKEQLAEPGMLPDKNTKRARAWHLPRQRRTEMTFLRNVYMPPAGVWFSSTKGFHPMPIPDDVYKQMTAFWEKYKSKMYDEPWDPAHNTVVNYHEVKTTMVSLDEDMDFRNRIANQYLKPLCEKWSGLKLHYESFYGIREYRQGHWLRNHLDRIDTHVISITMNFSPIGSPESWPIEVVNSQGVRLRYEHLPGWMVLYESSVVIHGRPYPLPDAFHHGAFVHFAPKQWDGVPGQMRDYQKQFITRKLPDGLSTELVDNIQLLPNSQPSKPGPRRSMNYDYGKPFDVIYYNYFTEPLSVYWIDQRNEEQFIDTIKPHKPFHQQTYHGHKFSIKDVAQKVVKLLTMDVQTEEYMIAPVKTGL